MDRMDRTGFALDGVSLILIWPDSAGFRSFLLCSLPGRLPGHTVSGLCGYRVRGCQEKPCFSAHFRSFPLIPIHFSRGGCWCWCWWENPVFPLISAHFRSNGPIHMADVHVFYCLEVKVIGRCRGWQGAGVSGEGSCGGKERELSRKRVKLRVPAKASGHS